LLLLPRKLTADRGADCVGAVASLQGRRQYKRQLHSVRPPWVLGVEETFGPLDVKPAAAQLMRQNRDARPFLGPVYQPCFDGIGGHVSELLNDGLLAQ
jgi:hypothetical protein